MIRDGNPDSAYQHITEALARSPDDPKLREQQIHFGDLAVADVLRRADSRPSGDLSGREQTIERARGYVSSRRGYIDQKLRELADKKSKVLEHLAIQATKGPVYQVLADLAPQSVYFRDDRELNASLERALDLPIMEEAAQRAEAGDSSNVIRLRDYIALFGLGSSIGLSFDSTVGSGFTSFLRRRTSQALGPKDRGEVAMWAALLGQEDARLRIAVTVQGTQDQIFAGALRAKTTGALAPYTVVFIGTPTEWNADSDLLAVVTLEGSKTKIQGSSKDKSSKFYEGTREIVSTAMQNYPQMLTPVYGNYSYVEKTIQAIYTGDVSIRVILRADAMFEARRRFSEQAQSEWIQNLGVEPSDKTVGPGNFLPSSIEKGNEAFMQHLGLSAAEGISNDLQDLSRKTLTTAIQDHIRERLAFAAALASAPLGNLSASDALPFVHAVSTEPAEMWRAEAIDLALKRAKTLPSGHAPDLASRPAKSIELDRSTPSETGIPAGKGTSPQ